MACEIVECQQGTEEWYQARLGIPTTSEFRSVLGKTFNLDGEPKDRHFYMLKLIGERITGEPATFYENEHMKRGKLMEPDARRLYEFLTDNTAIQIGFLRNRTPKGRIIGCSPDSFIGNDGMLEIKTKLPHLHLDVILKNKIPTEHYAQCQGALNIAEREWIDFMCYWPKIDPFLHRVYRDEGYIRHLRSELDRFWDDMLRVEAALRNGVITAPISTSTPLNNPLGNASF